MTTRIEQIIKDFNRSNTIPLADKRVFKNAFKRQEEALGIAEAFVNANINSNQLISGGAVWVSGLTFYVSDCVFVINGELFTSQASTVTLSDADASNPRIDVIAVNKDGTVDVVDGTAAATPVKPEVDPDAQVEVTFATVAAMASTPTGVSNTIIYDEDDDWTTAVSNARIVKAATVDPYAGTKHVHFNAAQSADYITFTSSSTLSASAIDKISFRVKVIDYGTTKKNRLRLALYNGNNRVSSWVNVFHGQYSFDGANNSDYQLISIPFADFNATDSFDVLRLQISTAPNQTMTLYVDDIQYNQGSPNTDSSQYARLGEHNVFSKAQGSAIVSLTDGTTVSWDAGAGNVFDLTLGGNRTIAAPTNVKPGYTYILHLRQDGTGSRTVTWNSVFKWAGGTAPTLSTAASAIDIISFSADTSGNLHGVLASADSQ